MEALRDEIQAFWDELPTNAELRREVEGAGLDLVAVGELDSATAIVVEKEGEGFDPATVAIIVAFAPAGVHMLDSLWDEVIVPWIRRRRGSDALGRKKGPR